MLSFQTGLKLVAITGHLAASVGFIIVNRTLVLTGTWKFPFPITVSCLHLLITAGFAFIACQIASCLQRLLKRSDGYHTISTSHTPSTYRRRSSDPIDELRSSILATDNTPEKTSHGGSTFGQGQASMECPSFFDKMREYDHPPFPVLIGILLAGRVMMNDYFLSHLDLSIYTSLQVIGPALAFWTFPILRHPTAMLFRGCGATLLALLTVLHFNPPSKEHFFIPLVLPWIVFDYLLVVGLWHRLARTNSQLMNFTNVRSSNSPDTFMRSLSTLLDVVTRAMRLLSQSAAIAAATTIPVLILTGELGSIHRNSYILDVNSFRGRFIAGAALQFASATSLFVCTAIIRPILCMSLQIPVFHFTLIALWRYTFPLHVWLNIIVATFLVLSALFHKDNGAFVSTTTNDKRSFWHRTRKLLFYTTIYAGVYGGVYLLDQYKSSDTFHLPYNNNNHINDTQSTQASPPSIDIPLVNENANDAYLGSRPSHDAAVNFTRLADNCAESRSKVEDVVHCMTYLAKSQHDYLIHDAKTKRSNTEDFEQSPEIIARSANPITISKPSTWLKNTPSTSKGSCSSRIIPYHTYWTGPASWRVELFIKAYLYSQDLSCSQLWIWIDEDADPRALDKMVHRDPVIRRLSILVDQKYIIFKRWTVPERIELPKDGRGIEQSIMNTLDMPTSEKGLRIVDGISSGENGTLWLHPDESYKTVSNPTQVSDFVRFLVLHLHGGVYLDLDVLLMRDFRPLLIPNPTSSSSNTEQPAWAEQWAEHCDPGDYNTAVLSLPANSSLSTYLLRGGQRMSMNFHPRVLGHMLWREGRNEELFMMQNAAFDPLVTNLRRIGTDKCTVPCHKNFESPFMRIVDDPEREWSAYDGKQIAFDFSGTTTTDRESRPDATNRTMENFFRGAFAYHIHNQWWKFPEQDSWMDVITRAQDGFFAGLRTNAYGEKWAGPKIPSYNRSGWGWHN